jgi:hypothetical protein
LDEEDEPLDELLDEEDDDELEKKSLDEMSQSWSSS